MTDKDPRVHPRTDPDPPQATQPLREGFGTLDTIDIAETTPEPPPSTGPEPTPTESLVRAPTLAGRYEVLGMLGAGAMGRVYRVRDTELDEVVALKMLRHELVSSDAAISRFRREVKLARRVTHPNVARTFDIGEHEGERFLTMEYIDGHSLGYEVHTRGRLSPRRAVELVVEIARGLSAAHAAGIVHRDLKPDNILVGKDGRVAISDFGIAHSFAGQGAATATSLTVGTPAYMAPEQVRGQEIDARADIYALGAILFELLTGHRAWDGDHALAVAAARLTEPAPDPRRYVPEFPPELAACVTKALQREPEDRFPDIDAMIAEMERLLATACCDMPGGMTADKKVLADACCVESEDAWADSSYQTIAVLPFDSAPSEEDDYLAEGLTEDVIDTLSMSPGLRVRPFGAVMKYAQGRPDVQAVGRELDVAVVVTGSLRHRGDKLQIRTRVISVEDGFQLWAKRFRCSISEVLEVSDEVANAVAEALTMEASPSRPQADRAADTGAVELYLRARHAMRRHWHDSTEEAIGLFDAALALSPGDARILSGAAVARARLGFVGTDRPELLAEAESYARRAIEAAPDRGEPYFALAMVHFQTGALSEAAEILEEAIALSPGSVDIHDLLGRTLLEVGPVDRAVDHLRTAIALDPNKDNTRWDLARAYALTGQWQRADSLLSLPTVQPEREWIRSINQSRFDLWRREPGWLDAELPDGPNPIVAPMVAALREIVRTGEVKPEHYELWDERIAGSINAPRRVPLFYQFKAETAAFEGDAERWAQAVSDAIDAGLKDRVWLTRCPLFAELHGTPYYEALVERLTDAG